jgi:hypothetical protein
MLKSRSLSIFSSRVGSDKSRVSSVLTVIVLRSCNRGGISLTKMQRPLTGD